MTEQNEINVGPSVHGGGATQHIGKCVTVINVNVTVTNNTMEIEKTIKGAIAGVLEHFGVTSSVKLKNLGVIEIE